MNPIQFTYTNSKGETLQRVIEPISANETHLEGVDLAIHATRTFRLDGIHNQEIVIRDTGEVVAVADFCSLLPRLVFQAKVKLPSGTSIHFTGFPSQRKDELGKMAIEGDLRVVKSITANLTYLVYNSKRAVPSAKKIEEARSIGAIIWTEEEFLNWLHNH